MISIQQYDAMKWANEYDGPLFHALLCDPPYHLTTIVKRFGKEGSTPAKFGTDGVFARSSKGFMGKVWDGGDIAFQPETWYAFMKVLHPGAFGMAFASSRGWHRLAVAIEDAGFIIHPTIFGWLYGSGFPKATRIDTQIDKMNGVEREVVETIPDRWTQKGGTYNFSTDRPQKEINKTIPATDLAKAWASHRYGLQALKPALEPIIVFQKPYEGRPVDCMVETGAGALNIDGGRIAHNEPCKMMRAQTDEDIMSGNGKYGQAGRHVDTLELKPSGRWPSNFILEDEEAARALDEQSGNHKTTWVSSSHQNNRSGEFLGQLGHPGEQGYNDDGGASRFFFNVQEQIDESDPVYYCSKASNGERNAGLENRPEREVAYADYRENMRGTDSFVTLYPDGSPRPVNKTRNPHPTVKPIALSKYLATLLLPPEMYAPRRIFVPFAGVASECIGAYQAMWEEIAGIEREKEYCEIAQARVDYWTSKPIQKEMF